MPKLPAVKPKELIRRLEKIGFVVDHQTGSHVVMYHENSGKRAVIPYRLKELPKGTLLAIIRESGVPKDEILEK